MLQKKYSIYHQVTIEGDQHLAVTIGHDYLVLVLGTPSKMAGLEWFDTSDADLEEALNYVKQHSRLIDAVYTETRLYYNLDEALLVPVGYFNTALAAAYMETAYGPADASRINVENVNMPHSVVNVYRSNESWHHLVHQYFRVVNKRHFHSRLAEQAATDTSIALYCFGTTITIVAVHKHLQLVRNFNAPTDADIMYHLLNVCRQTAIDPAEATLSVSGIIEITSPVIRQVSTAFAKTVFEQPAAGILGKDAMDTYPHHYFTPFINLLA